jgi:hypothetical protein
MGHIFRPAGGPSTGISPFLIHLDIPFRHDLLSFTTGQGKMGASIIIRGVSLENPPYIAENTGKDRK